MVHTYTFRPGKLRQENCGLEASLGYKSNPSLSNKTKKRRRKWRKKEETKEEAEV